MKEKLTNIGMALLGVVIVLVLMISTGIRRVIDFVRDSINGDVDRVLGGFKKLEARLDRAQLSAARQIKREDARIDHYNELIDRAEERATILEDKAFRANRVMGRIKALTE